MARQFDETKKQRSELKKRIIGLGERSFQKSYYPELRRRLQELERFRVFLEQTRDMIFFISLPQGHIVDVNGTGCKRLASTHETLVHHSFFFFVNDEMKRRLLSFEEERGENEVALATTITTTLYDVHSKPIPVEVSISRYHEGRETYLILLARDISDKIQTARALDESKTNYRHLFESIGDAIMLHDNSGHILHVNEAACKRYGYTRDEFSTLTVFNIDVPDEFAEIPKRIESVITKKTYTFETQHKRKDGSVINVEVSATRTTYHGADAIMSIVRDITAQKNTERALRESEEHYRITLRSIGDAVIVTDTKGCVVRMNTVAERLTGWAVSDARMLPLGEVFRIYNAKTGERCEDPVSRVLETGAIIALSSHTTLHGKNGTVYNVADSGAPIRNDAGRLVGVVLVFRDITKEYRMREEMRHNFAFTQALLAAIPTPVFYKDVAGCYQGCNKAFEEFMGVTSEEIRGKTVAELWPSELAETYHEKDLELMRSPEHQIYEHRVRSADAEYHDVIFAKDVIRTSEGEVVGIVGAFVDITDRKRMEVELKRSNQDLEQFAYIASHDLQEPLRNVASYVQLLQKRYGKYLDKTANEYIQFAVEGAKRMKLLIKGVFTLSRIGHDDEPYITVDCDEVVRGVLDTLSSRVNEKGAEIVIPDTLPVVRGNYVQIAEVFQNIVGNALKFVDGDTAPRIEISYADAGERWEFIVRDNGIGFEDEFREKVFVMFKRLHRLTQYEGTGIGLAICKRIIEQHNGSIRVESEKGKGTAFFFTLPKG